MKILEKYFPYSLNISITRSSKAIILFLVTFLKYIFIAARQNTWLGKRLVQVLAPTFIGLIGIQGRKLRIMKSRRTIIEFVQRSTEPKSVSVNKRSISCCLNTRFLALKGRKKERERGGEGKEGTVDHEMATKGSTSRKIANYFDCFALRLKTRFCLAILATSQFLCPSNINVKRR